MYFKRPVCVLCLAFTLLLYLTELLFPPWSHAEQVRASISDKTILQVTGTITKIEHKNYATDLYLKDISILSDIPFLNEEQKRAEAICLDGLLAYLSDSPQEEQQLHIGSRVSLRGEFSCFESAENTGNFDAFRYYAIRHIDGRLKKARVLAVSTSYSMIGDTLFRLKERTKEVYFTYLDEQKAGTLTALILGDKTELDTEVKESYQNAGIAHILSLSGLHIATLGLLLVSFCRKCGIKTLPAALIAGVIMLLYSIMTGLSTSTVRALIMFLLGITAQCLKRTYDLLSGAALSAVLLLAENPYYLHDSGFLLSFTAVIGISLVYPILLNISETVLKSRVLYGLHNSKKKPAIWAKTVVSSLIFSLSIQLATLPTVEYSFFQIPLYGIILNLLVIPLMTGVLSLGILLAVAGNMAMILYKISTLHMLFNLSAKIFSKIAYAILYFYDRLTDTAQGLGGGLYICGKPEDIQIILYIAALGALILAFSLIEGKLKRMRFAKEQGKGGDTEGICRRFAILSALVITAAVWVLSYRHRAALELHALSVGQGDSMLIYGKDTPVILIDGGATDVKNTGKYRMMPCIKAHGIDTIDYVFISHFDADHVNGIIELLSDPHCGIRIKRIVVGASVPYAEANENYDLLREAAQTNLCNGRGQGVPVFTMNAGDVVETGHIRMTALAPDIRESAWKSRDINDNSLVLHLLYKKNGFSALFTGDMSKSVEQGLIEDLKRGKEAAFVLKDPVTLLKVAHHGSRRSFRQSPVGLIIPTGIHIRRRSII